MLTIFAVPKPFHGHIGMIQRNAIRSWTLLRPACEILLMGDEEGTAEAAAEFGVRHVPNVARNHLGTPLVNDLFHQAQRLSGNEFFCYVNSDIILMSDFMEALQRVAAKKKRFLLVGHRWNVDVNEALDFGSDWEEDLRARVRQRGILAGVTSIDFFAFPRGLLGELPAFAVGRPGWDNWMLYRARFLSVPLIDSTPVVIAVHQNHPYAHHPQGKAGLWNGEEALTNQKLAGGPGHLFSLFDTTHLLTARRLRHKYDLDHLLRRCNTVHILYPRLPTAWIRKTLSASRPLRSRFGLTLSSLLGRSQ